MWKLTSGAVASSLEKPTKPRLHLLCASHSIAIIKLSADNWHYPSHFLSCPFINSGLHAMVCSRNSTSLLFRASLSAAEQYVAAHTDESNRINTRIFLSNPNSCQSPVCYDRRIMTHLTLRTSRSACGRIKWDAAGIVAFSVLLARVICPPSIFIKGENWPKICKCVSMPQRRSHARRLV